jgi:hypothetical protein
VLRRFIIDQVLFLWERLPAAIISWQDATPQKSLTYLKGVAWRFIAVQFSAINQQPISPTTG